MLNDLMARVWLALASLFHWRRRNARYVVLMGGPGAGKGTLSSQLAPALNLPHLSMGDIFRREIAAQTKLGMQVAQLVKEGKLVSAELALSALKAELEQPRCFRGAVLDGFPRMLEQAVLLDKLLAGWGNTVSKVILLEVPEEDLIERLSNRRTCSNKSCGRIYHLLRDAPREPSKCDACGQPLYQRDDDVPGTIRVRLNAFKEESRPLRDHYRAKGILVPVSSTNAKGKEAVFAEVMSALQNS